MIDAILVSPGVHIAVGTLTLLASIVALIISGYAAWKKQPFTRKHHIGLIIFQLTLMIQTLVGVKLLDQGLGPRQLYIHYLGGMAPIAFILLFYWFPTGDRIARSRRATVVSFLSFLFVLMTFTIGSIYVPGGV